MTVTAPPSAPSAPTPAPSAPAAAPAPVSAPKPATAVPQAGSKPPAPSVPKTEVKSPRLPPARGDGTKPDPLREAVHKAAQMVAPAEGDAPVADAPKAGDTAKPAVSAQDKAKAALSTTAAPTAKPEEAKPVVSVTPVDPALEIQRIKSEHGRQVKAFEAELAKHRQAADAQAKAAELAKLKPYMGGHPEHNQTMARVQLAENFEAAFDALPPEMQTPAVRNSMAHRMGVSNDDLNVSKEWKAHKERVSAEFAQDQDGYIAKRAEQVAEHKFNELFERRVQEFQIRRSVNETLSDPVVKQYYQQDPEVFKAELAAVDGNASVLADKIHLYHAMLAEQKKNEDLTKRLGELEAQSGMVKEQKRLVQGRATITREPASAPPVVDPLAATRVWAKANNVPPTITNPQFFAKLKELQAQNGKPSNA